MASYDVDYKCGHTGQVDLAGKMKLRIERLDYLKEQVCPACHKLEINTLKEQAKLDMNELNLPVFTKGSQKQVDWANQILVTSYNRIEKVKSQLKNEKGKFHLLYLAETDRFEKLFAEFDSLVKNERHPSFWIEKRHKLTFTLEDLFSETVLWNQLDNVKRKQAD